MSQIIVVDDELPNRLILEELLGDDYEVVSFESGNELLDKVSNCQPDLILLDVMMPGLNGIEACQQLKSQPDYRGLPVIFVSALSSSEDRLAGYGAGGDDYITKPFDDEELFAKVKMTLANKKAMDALQSDQMDAMSTAMSAMAQSSEMGVLLAFMRDSHTCKNYEELIDALIGASNNFGLSCIAQLRNDERIVTKKTAGEVGRLELEIVCSTVHDRIEDFGCRTLFTYGDVSILIRDMPLDDPGLYGRTKDNLAILAEAVEARMEGLKMSRKMVTQQSMLTNVSSQFGFVLAEVEREMRKSRDVNMALLFDQRTRMETLFLSLGLTESQEEMVLELLTETQEKSEALFDQNLALDKKLEQIIVDLDDGAL